ncbi:MAG: riboflavin biosynthesis protein RibF [Ruminococcus sp.]|nr:riboflavin biosynthesis protein RibF [Ruminococcus sp.]
MQRLFEISPENKNTAIALGFFDGLHTGHRNVISVAVKAKEQGLMPVCFTFAKSPKSILSGNAVNGLMTDDEKIKTLEELGIEKVYEADFNKIRNITANEFFEDILLRTLKAKKLSCGFNYRFGKNGEGDINQLEKLCSKYSVELEIIPPEKIGGQLVSSTLIRNLIKSGDIRLANKMLCGKFGFVSKIEYGKQLGRKLGTPTINQQLCKELVIPKFGVYASVVTLENGKKYCGVTNIGIKPTVGGTTPLSETWLPEYKGDELYGQSADIRLIEFIRPERKFSGIEELQKTILDNGKTALQIYLNEML